MVAGSQPPAATRRPAGPATNMPRAIVFTGGVGHDFEHATPVLAGILVAAGYSPQCSEHLGEVIAALERDPRALLVVYALRWSMTQHEKYAPQRARWALSLTPVERSAIAGHVGRGAGLLGVHTASICFDDWPQWRELLGAAWVWGQSSHPPYGPVQSRMHPRHVLTRGLPPIALSDEVYSDLHLAAGIDVAMWTRAVPAALAPAALPEQPSVWTHRYGRGRVVYSGLGHDAQSLRDPVHQTLLRRAAVWAGGAADAAVEAA